MLVSNGPVLPVEAGRGFSEEVTVITISELDVARVRRWADSKTPPEFRDQMRIEVDQTPRGFTFFGCRSPSDGGIGPEWIRTPFARLGYVKKRREWTLYWGDRNSKFHRYERVGPTPQVVKLLDEIDADPTCIFWG